MKNFYHENIENKIKFVKKIFRNSCVANKISTIAIDILRKTIFLFEIKNIRNKLLII